uniref:ANK_REP_REGION domain-containing protein n=1 Tax=Globodera pallida TaxID=36090 RepID=A0A183CM75_GLOPA
MSGKKGADWYDESDRDKMNMLSACAKGMVAEVERYLNGGMDMEEEDDDGVTALQIAAAKGHRSLVELLLRRGAQVDRANYAGMTPFLHACREGHQDVITVLANHGANVNVTTGLGVSAMALASAGRHIGAVRTLRGLNSAVNSVSSSRTVHQVAPSPYMVAFFQMDIEICGDANVWHQIRWMDGMDAHKLGETLNFPPILMSLNYAENSLKAPKSAKDIRSVIQTGDENELDHWMREGRVPPAISDGITPLMYAAFHAQHRIAEQLLKSACRSSIDAQENVLGLSALMLAIVVGDNLMVQIMLRHGANPRLSSTTKEPFTAIDLSHFSGLSHDTLFKLYKQFLMSGKGEKNLKRELSDKKERRVSRWQNWEEVPAGGGGVPSPASVAGGGNQKRLRRVIESFTRNIIGLTGDLSGQISGGTNGNDSFPLAHFPNARARFDALVDTAHLNGSDAPRFVLAEQILRGDARAPATTIARAKALQLDARIVLARQIAISWMVRGDTLRPMAFEDGLSQLKNAEESAEVNGLYLAAQWNAEKLFKNVPMKRQRRKTDPSQATAQSAILNVRLPLTPQLIVRTANSRGHEQQVQKSPSSVSRHKVLLSQCERTTVRKAPHRLGGHQRVASSGSGGTGPAYGSNTTSNSCGSAGTTSTASQSQPDSPQATLDVATVWEPMGKSSSIPPRPSIFRVQYHHHFQQQDASETPVEPQQQKLYNKQHKNGQHSPNTLALQQKMPKPLTKELIQRKVYQWDLQEEFEQCFVAEEVDELTFASLRETEIQEVLSRHGRANDLLVHQRFLELIADIKRCTGCSELL